MFIWIQAKQISKIQFCVSNQFRKSEGQGEDSETVSAPTHGQSGRRHLKYEYSTEEDKEIGAYSLNCTGAKEPLMGRQDSTQQEGKPLTRNRQESIIDIQGLIMTRHPLMEFGSTHKEFRSGTTGRCVSSHPQSEYSSRHTGQLTDKFHLHSFILVKIDSVDIVTVSSEVVKKTQMESQYQPMDSMRRAMDNWNSIR